MATTIDAPTFDFGHGPTFSFPELDGERKLRELVLYISGKCDSDPTFGAVKLNKILVFADFIAYYRFGVPITGVEYMRLPQGPAPRRLLPITKEMESAHELTRRRVQTGKFEQKRIVPLRDPDLSMFRPEEIALVDEVITAFWKKTATAVSEFSHGTAWKVAEDRGLIPYESVFISDDPVDEYDRTRSEELAREYGW